MLQRVQAISHVPVEQISDRRWEELTLDELNQIIVLLDDGNVYGLHEAHVPVGAKGYCMFAHQLLEQLMSSPESFHPWTTERITARQRANMFHILRTSFGYMEMITIWQLAFLQWVFGDDIVGDNHSIWNIHHDYDETMRFYTHGLSRDPATNTIWSRWTFYRVKKYYEEEFGPWKARFEDAQQELANTLT